VVDVASADPNLSTLVAALSVSMLLLPPCMECRAVLTLAISTKH
jgi:hypothetical protein